MTIFLQILQPKVGNSTTKLVQQFCNTITVNMKDWTSRLSKWWWWFEIFFGLHEWPLLKKKKVGYFKRLGPFKRCYNLQLVNIFCDHFMQSFVASCSCTLRLNQCIKKISQWRRQFISRESLYRVSHIETYFMNWIWEIEICKLEFVWRCFWNPEVWIF